MIRPDLAKRVALEYAALRPLVRWLNAAVGLPPAARR
jgi:hypothetical protein